jgi:hypothetical protein
VMLATQRGHQEQQVLVCTLSYILSIFRYFEPALRLHNCKYFYGNISFLFKSMNEGRYLSNVVIKCCNYAGSILTSGIMRGMPGML